MCRHPLLPLLPLCAVLTLAAGGCQRVDHAALCERVRKCRPEVTRALVDRQPRQSKFMKTVRKEMPERLVPHLIKSCPERFGALLRTNYGKKLLRSCAPLAKCDDFARCIAPALEP